MTAAIGHSAVGIQRFANGFRHSAVGVRQMSSFSGIAPNSVLAEIPHSGTTAESPFGASGLKLRSSPAAYRI
jgi:hypothetical protein